VRQLEKEKKRKESEDKKKRRFYKRKTFSACVSHERLRIPLPTSAGISNRGGGEALDK